MNKKKLFLLTLLLILATSLFVGCNSFKSRIDAEDHNCKVIIDANGGVRTNMEVRTYNMEKGSCIPVPSFIGNIIIPQPGKEYHTIVGYFRVTLDENNEIVKDENGEIIWGEQWDFQWDRVEGDVVLAVKWSRDITYEFVEGVLDNGNALPDSFKFDAVCEHTFVDGVCTQCFEIEDEATNPMVYSVPSTHRIAEPSISEKPTAEGFTFMGYYWDKECKQEIAFPYVLTADDIARYEEQAAINKEYNLPIYTKWLQGEYELVETESDFTSVLANSNYYFLTDELDMTGKKISMSNFSGTIEGNNCVIKNLTIKITQAKNVVDYSAMFNKLTNTAKINNITFENLIIEFVVFVDSAENKFPINKLARVSLFSSSKDAAAVLNNVNIDATIRVVHDKNKTIAVGGETEEVENDFECEITFYSFSNTEADKINVIKTGGEIGNEAKEFKFTYPAA